MSLPSSRCVPITTSTLPAFTSSTTCFCSAWLTNRRQHPHRDRERREPLAERDEVLLGEERRRHEHGDLLALHHGLERRAHGDLGLAEPDVAADEPIHRLGQLHVGLDLVDRRDLVGRLLVGERVLELVLPRRVGTERVTGHRQTHGVEAHELAGHVAHGALDLGGRARPVGAAHAMHARGVAADVLRDHADRVGRHVELVAAARTRARGSRARRRRARGG